MTDVSQNPLSSEKLNPLVHAWREATVFMSNPHDIFGHDTFLAIVQLGRPAVPAIIEHLKQKPSMLLIALEHITGERPWPDKARGNVLEMSQACIKWFEETANNQGQSPS